MARDLSDLAASAGATAAALKVAQKVGVRKSALHVTKGIRAEILKATGDGRLSGVGKNGAKIGARYDVKGSTNPTALVRGTGKAFPLIERDTGAHTITPRGKRRKKKGALKFEGRFSASARHPGTRGKHPFQKGVAKTAPDTKDIFQDEVRNAVKKGWGI